MSCIGGETLQLRKRLVEALQKIVENASHVAELVVRVFNDDAVMEVGDGNLFGEVIILSTKIKSRIWPVSSALEALSSQTPETQNLARNPDLECL